MRVVSIEVRRSGEKRGELSVTLCLGIVCSSLLCPLDVCWS